MEKELKELMLKLKSAGLQNEANKLIKFSEISISYLDFLREDNYRETIQILKQIKNFLGDDIYKFLIDEKGKGLNRFASSLSDFVYVKARSDEFEMLKAFNPNKGKNPMVAFSNHSFNDEDLKKERSFKLNTENNPNVYASGDLYRGYKDEGKEIIKIELGFTTYHIRKGDHWAYGEWLSLSHRTKNPAAVKKFLNEKEGGVDPDSGEKRTRLDMFKLMYEDYKEDRERDEAETETTSTATGTGTGTGTTGTGTTGTTGTGPGATMTGLGASQPINTAPFVRVPISNYREDCGATAKIGSYCQNNGNSAIEKIQKMINLLSNGDQIKEDGYFGNITAQALHQMGVNYNQPANNISSDLSTLESDFGHGSYSLSLNQRSSRTTGTRRRTSRKKVKSVLPDESGVIGMW